MKKLEETLKQRRKEHGDFSAQAALCQSLKDAFRSSIQTRWDFIRPEQREAIEMIFCKISRIAFGNCFNSDHWHDIAGYASLGEAQCCDDLSVKES